MLLHLRDVREHPPSLNVSLASEIVDSVNVQSKYNVLNTDAIVNNDHIDWDISVDSSQIDWDIGTVEETEDAGNGLGQYEIVNASEILQSSLPNEAVESDQIPSNKQVDGLLAEISVPDIAWDVSVETPQVDVIDDVSLTNIGYENQTYVLENLTHPTGTKEERSQLLETEYRNKILDDLYEVHVYYEVYLFICSLSCPVIIFSFTPGFTFGLHFMLSDQIVFKSAADGVKE